MSETSGTTSSDWEQPVTLPIQQGGGLGNVLSVANHSIPSTIVTPSFRRKNIHKKQNRKSLGVVKLDTENTGLHRSQTGCGKKKCRNKRKANFRNKKEKDNHPSKNLNQIGSGKSHNPTQLLTKKNKLRKLYALRRATF